MKLKKLKKILKAINDLAKRPASEIKGFINTGYKLSTGHPLILLPTQGKYVLPEVTIIDKIVRAIEPKEIIVQALKANVQSGILLMSVHKDKLRPNTMLLLVHTPKGCISYTVESLEDFVMPKNYKDGEYIELPDSVKI